MGDVKEEVQEKTLEDTEKLEMPKNSGEVKGESSKGVLEESQGRELPENVVLLSRENEEFIVKLAVAQQSEMIKNAILDGCAEKPIPLLNVSAPILAKVIEFWKQHVVDAAKGEELTAWDREFLGGLSQADLFELMLAANYMEAKSLLDCTCQLVADTIKEMKVEEVRDYFGIEGDLTEEEQQKIQQENSWAFA